MVGYVEEAHAALHKATPAGAHVLHRCDRLQRRLPGLAVLEHSPSLLQVSTKGFPCRYRGSHIVSVQLVQLAPGQVTGLVTRLQCSFRTSIEL